MKVCDSKIDYDETLVRFTCRSQIQCASILSLELKE